MLAVGVNVYSGHFSELVHRWAREGRLFIFFEMPAGKVPVDHL
jgi:hypothetical protein